MVEKLYEAVDAGVRLDILVRGICTLRPGVVPNARLRVRSLLGRYLEHSRIYKFAHGGPDGSNGYFIGSADLMERNLDKRVEVLTPVMHQKHQAWLDAALQFMWADDVVAFELGSDDEWRRVGPSDFTSEHDAQARLRDWIADSQQRLGIPNSR